MHGGIAGGERSNFVSSVSITSGKHSNFVSGVDTASRGHVGTSGGDTIDGRIASFRGCIDIASSE
jgi:hypothetical protein